MLGLKVWSDWYRVSHTDFKANRGHPLLQFYDNSICTLLSSLYPEYKWSPSKFCSLSPGTFSFHPSKFQELWREGVGRDFMNRIFSELLFSRYVDCQKLTATHFLENPNGAALIRSCKSSPVQLMKTMYPEAIWRPWLFSSVPRYFFFL